MKDTIALGKQFEFDNGFWSRPRKYGVVNLYQLGEICCEGGYTIEPHKQVCHEISYIISGKGEFYNNGIKYDVEQGDIFISPAGHTHEIRTDEHTSLRYAYVGFEFNIEANSAEYEKLIDFYSGLETFHVKDKMDLMIPFLRTIDEFYGKRPYDALMIEDYIKQIIILTYRAFQPTRVPIYMPDKSINAVGYTVYQVIRYIENNIFDIKEVRSISENLGYSYSYISHLFKEKTGITLQKYINQKKIEKGLELLKYGKLNITQVAVRLNYETVQSFSKAFKRTMSISPTDYIKTELED